MRASWHPSAIQREYWRCILVQGNKAEYLTALVAGCAVREGFKAAYAYYIDLEKSLGLGKDAAPKYIDAFAIRASLAGDDITA